MQEFTSKTEFNFGGGSRSLKKDCSNSMQCCRQKCVVDDRCSKREIPLLLSKESMKTADSKINFVNDRINVFGKDIQLHFTASRHYAIPLNETNINLKTSLEDSNFVEVLLTIEQKSKRKRSILQVSYTNSLDIL